MNHKYRSSQVSSSKDKMDEDQESLLDYYNGKEAFIELVVGFVIFATYLFMNQIDALVPQFFYMYDIPVHNLGIFLSKLFSSKSISMIFGSLLQYVIVVSFPSQIYNYTMLGCGLLFSMRMLNMFFIYSDISLSKMYVLFNFDAFCTGFFLTSFLGLVTQFMAIALLSTSISVSFAFFLQRPINYLFRRRPLVMFKVHGWISLAISCVYLGAHYFYDSNHKFTPSYKETIDKIKSCVDTFELIMMDIKRNPSYVYYYTSLLKTLDQDVSGLFGDVKKLKNLKGITNETEIMDSILKELKDKVKELLYYIEFTNQLRDKSLYDIKVSVKTKTFQQLTRFKIVKKSWDGMKTHLDSAKNNFMFKFRSPINYDYSLQGTPKLAAAPAKALGSASPRPTPQGPKSGLMPPQLSSFDLKTTPAQTTEAYSGESGSAYDDELSGVTPTEVDLQVSGSGTEPTDHGSGQEVKIVTNSPKNEETLTTETTITEGTTKATITEGTITEGTTTEGTTTAKSTQSSEPTIAETEKAITETESSLIGTESIAAGSELPSTISELSTTATVRSSTPTERTSTSGPKGTIAVSPESGSTQATGTSNPGTTVKKPKSTKSMLKPVFIRPTFKTDRLDLKLDRIVIDLGGLADSIVKTYNVVKSFDGVKEEDKIKCLESIHDCETKVIQMDSRFNEVYRGLTDNLRYDQNVLFNALKHIHFVQKKDTVKLLKTKEEMRTIFAKNKSEVISPLLMFFVASLIKDFLFPAILPFTFMQIYKNDMILLAAVIEIYGSILVLIIDRLAVEFRSWHKTYNIFWIMAGPLVVTLVGAITALNTNFLSIRAFFSSESKVLLVTVSLLVLGSILKQLSYVCVANYVHYQSGDVLGNVPYLLTYHLGAIIFRFFVCKLAIKTEAKVNLGFRFPNLPIQQNPGSSCLLLWLKAGFKSSFKELLADTVTNLWRYL
ncbi:conserved hypothetical protein [Theileria orientalis strain Shintoku]|uniref:Uncharacterized protein n=1 Tax=Theileria orientalis strain Shintoku TaxID=869250 RepID=J4CDX1_THEOR|nr:conserved hypothetical protein [Theileria orientalis strain Shintoku]BAM41882.1 conserved hypothetical protein [Theileria orientalis strain Shintoku]|eukprot:XP_009692183.1 conserved hypothetical protein [Theileria orientalis strain Shintoku]